MRLVTLILVALIVMLQYPLWLGKGSWTTVLNNEAEVNKLRSDNAVLRARNQSLSAEVTDLKNGYDAIEERARSELGMIKQDEVFFQVLKTGVAPVQLETPPPSTAASAASALAKPGAASLSR